MDDDTYKLNKSDARLLQYFRDYGVPSEHTIAEALRMSPSTVNYKMKKLEKEKVIVEYRYRIDYAKIGLASMAWMFLDANFPQTHIDEMFTELKKIPHIFVITLLTGTSDFALKIYGKSMEEVTQTILTINKKFKGKIRNSKAYFIVKDYKRHNIILDATCPLKHPLDKTEFMVLNYFFSHPKSTIKHAAESLGLHRNTVMHHWKQLLDKKVVLKKSAILNPKYYFKAGVAFNAFVLFNAVPGFQEDFADEIVKVNEIHEMNLLNADYDFLTLARTADIDSFYDFKSGLYRQKAMQSLVSHSQTLVILKSVVNPPQSLDFLYTHLFPE